MPHFAKIGLVLLLVAAPQFVQAQVLTGIDVLRNDEFQTLQGKRVGLITNHTGITRDGQSTVQVLHGSDKVNLVALFSPEHGIAGLLDQPNIADSKDSTTGLKIHSLYGAARRPTAEMLDGVDVLVFDIQDIGCRFYTYISTMGEAMRAAAEHGVDFVVLDRPNPINGLDIEGPVLDAGSESFVGFHTIPVRHGMTVGELALMFKAEFELDLDLEVIKVTGWSRGDFFETSGLLWVNPSPNMRSLTQALLYPGIGLLETTNLSVGRGTDTPFEVVGAPWIDGQRLAAELNQQGIAGVCFVPIRFRPDASKFAGELCGGINILITDRQAFEPLKTGWAVATQLRALYPDTWEVTRYQRLLADKQVLDLIQSGSRGPAIESSYQDELAGFKERRKNFLVY